jgi:hypothetical protein
MAKKIAKHGILVDAHVHLHDPARALDDLRQAAIAFATFGKILNPAVVMLAERAGYDVFRRLATKLESTGEPESLWFEHADQRLLVVAGRQIVTSEGLEVLGLATREQIPDGLPAQQVRARLYDTDALVVLPWGVGKWLGKRGRLVDQLIESATPGRLFLGDNGGRPSWWRVPQFSRGFPVLAGSDPLPIPGSARTIGRFGSVVGVTLSEESPAGSLKQALRDPTTRIGTYGRSAPALRFFTDQTRLRISRKGMELA